MPPMGARHSGAASLTPNSSVEASGVHGSCRVSMRTLTRSRNSVHTVQDEPSPIAPTPGTSPLQARPLHTGQARQFGAISSRALAHISLSVIVVSSPAAKRRIRITRVFYYEHGGEANVFELRREKAPFRPEGRVFKPKAAHMEPISSTITFPTASANWLMWRMRTSSRP